MHALLLGITRHHFRVVIGTKWDERDDEVDTVLHNQTPKEVDLKKGHRLLASPSATVKQLETLPIPALRQLCIEYDVIQVVTQSGHRVKKRLFANALLVHTSIEDDSNAEEIPTAGITPLDSGLTGINGDDTSLEGDLAEINAELGDKTDSFDGNPMLSTKELKEIQQDIRDTIRPTWQTGPPPNFGSPAHGKLKADQWRTCIEFDLPFSLVRMWEASNEQDIPDELCRRRQKHAQEYKRYMMRYLHTLRELCPNDDLHPVHHNALHIPDFLQRFGPMHGWWMFPFEHLIGILQKVKTNFKIGQLESTIMNTFCAASELKVFLQRPGCPEALRACAPILADCFPDMERGTLNHDIQTLGKENYVQHQKGKAVHLEEDVPDALATTLQSQSPLAQGVREHNRLEFRG
ncbi:hypothetical protein K443DRAFT_114901 [Laccaria amethystina LaAM-08-1]|uniref:Uncharacterized protein n=1 Tax=Laccaria amethystina LaAM-08-1 TaxID=1095629 RepID=A0A0C9X1P7_9AGAR|nr:hypothetical protein K443DRAFT_114901 [Laccaria amethystina LaAM-08-1]